MGNEQFQVSIEKLIQEIFQKLEMEGVFLESNRFDKEEYGLYIPQVVLEQYPGSIMTHLYSIQTENEEYTYVLLEEKETQNFKTFLFLKNGNLVTFHRIAKVNISM